MKTTLWKLLSTLLALLAILSLLCAVTVTGSGFLDLSNVARGVFLALAILFALAAILTGRRGWKAR